MRASSAARASASDASGATRRAWEISKKGNLQNLKLNERAAREALGPNECRIAVRAIGLNFADVFTVLGLYSAAPEGTFVPGLECCGEVVETAASGSNFVVGDRVMCVVRFGAFADEINCPVTQMRKLPNGWSFEEGSAFLVQGLTSYYGLKALGDVRKNASVLVHSAAGGCGLQSLGICERVGAKAIAVIGNPSKVDTLKERFPSLKAIIVRDRKRFAKQVRDACEAIGASEGVDIVFDATLGDFFQGGWENLARGGRYVVYGAADLTPRGDSIGLLGWIKLAWKFVRRQKVDPLMLPGENKGILGFNLIWQFDRQEELARLLAELLALDLPAPKVGATFEFSQLPEALRLFQTGQTTGKVVVKI
uniref:Enoyl reductase (ER) domain-containing protein n=1 Tax=Ostreococcus sp. 'lucimarinus' TaxID=242159 RepID=A0A7R9SZ03_9CHLO